MNSIVRFLNAENAKSVLTYNLIFVLSKCMITYTQILDSDPRLRISSFMKDGNRIVRYYHDYGVFVTYKYSRDPNMDPQAYSLLDMKIFRINEQYEIKHAKGFEQYFRSLLLITIPDFFQRCGITNYRVLFINSFPPFIDESRNTVGTFSNIFQDFSVEVTFSDIGYSCIEINGVKYVCKILQRRNNRYASLNRFDCCSMITTCWNTENSTLLSMLLDDFLDKKSDWKKLEQLLGVNKNKKGSNYHTNVSNFDLNGIGMCENLTI